MLSYRLGTVNDFIYLRLNFFSFLMLYKQNVFKYYIGLLVFTGLYAEENNIRPNEIKGVFHLTTRTDNMAVR